MTVKEFKRIKPEDVLLIDVREPNEYAENNIPNSVLMPLSTVSIDKIKEIQGQEGNKKIVIHCRSGMRSLQVCKNISLQDPDIDVYNLEGGINAWLIDSGSESDSIFGGCSA